MVGGIIDSVFHSETSTSVTVIGAGCESSDCKGIELVPTDLPLAPGDQIWWQDRRAFWTPQDGSREDIAIQRIGYSFSVKND